MRALCELIITIGFTAVIICLLGFLIDRIISIINELKKN